MDTNNTSSNIGTNNNHNSNNNVNDNDNDKDTNANIDPFVQSPFQQWEIAFIYAFITTFNPQADITPSFYKLPNITPEELEAEIVKKESQPIHQFICASLSNALNRKKAIESYNNAFSQIVADKYKTFDLDLDYNPLGHVKFTELDPNVKLLLLRSLVEWQLQDSQAIKTILEHCNTHTGRGQINPIHSTPIGIDSKKRSYWQFGESPWVWREKMQLKSACHWETVCKNRTELEQLVEQLSVSNRAEKQLIQYITENLYELADKTERRKIRKEQAELRKLFPPEVSITSTQLRSRTRGAGRINYNIDDAYDFVDEDDDYEEDDDEDEERRGQNKRKSESNPLPPRTAPTRWSSRLNDTDDTRWQDLEENQEMDEDQEEEQYKDGEQELEIQVDDEDEVMNTLKSDTSMIDVVNDDDDGDDDDDDDISINDSNGDTMQQQVEKVMNSHSHSHNPSSYKNSNNNSSNNSSVDNVDLMEIVDSNSQFTVHSMSQD